jgi:hypothetical protein
MVSKCPDRGGSEANDRMVAGGWAGGYAHNRCGLRAQGKGYLRRLLNSSISFASHQNGRITFAWTNPDRAKRNRTLGIQRTVQLLIGGLEEGRPIPPLPPPCPYQAQQPRHLPVPLTPYRSLQSAAQHRLRRRCRKQQTPNPWSQSHRATNRSLQVPA